MITKVVTAAGKWLTFLCHFSVICDEAHQETIFVQTFLTKQESSQSLHPLTFKNLASYIQDGRTATLQMLHFIFFFFQQI